MRPINLDSLGFKFAIGDVVLHRGMAHAKAPPVASDEVKPDWELFRGARSALRCARFVITQRLAQECSGGVQLMYSGTWCDGETGHISGSVMLHEAELIPLPT